MKKRSKLDLSAGVGQGKRQATGFAAQAPADPPPELQPTERTVSARMRPPRQSVVVERQRFPTGLLVKAVAVAAITGLSLYLLKRRFF